MKRGHSVISTGTTSLVLIFVMLCMLTFSVLSLASARANLRLSEKSAQRTTDYYAAENAANETLIQIEQAARQTLMSQYAASALNQNFTAQVCKRLADPSSVRVTEENRLAYQVPLGEDQHLSVELEVFPEANTQGLHYEIRAWQVVTDYDWRADDHLDVLDPGQLPFALE